MNKAQNRPTMTKVLSMILALVMVLSLLPLSGFTGSDTQAASDESADNDSYRIVHLDCGREYFTPEWIKALINEMAAAGYNQLQLAFGNGGFRFYLDDLAIGNYTSYAVKEALEEGNKDYNTNGDNGKGTTDEEWISYNPTTNALTEAQMTEIISYAKNKGIEIVPMLNTPGHMHALIAAMEHLNIEGTLTASSKVGCLNLSNEDAVSFTKALVAKYAVYFAKQGCQFFNLATDEYSSFDNAFYTYADSLVDIVVSNGMTPRVFNDAIKSDSSKIKSDSSYPTQVCYWYPSDSVNASTIRTLGYSMINTNHDYYYVSTNEDWNLNKEGYTFVGDYNETTWINKAKSFSNTSFNNGKGLSTTVNDPVGSMFCIWCNTPGKNTETQIAQQIRMILRVIGARMQNSDNYSDSSVLVAGGFAADGSINTVSTDGGDDGDTVSVTEKAITVSVNGTDTADVAGTILDENTTYNVGDGTYATYTVKHNAAGTGEPEQVSSITSGQEYLIGDGTNWLWLNNGSVSSTSDSNEATKWTITGGSSSGYKIESENYYLTYGNSSGSGSSKTYSLTTTSSSSNTTWTYNSNGSFSIKPNSGGNYYYLTYSSGWKLVKSSGTGRLYTEGSSTEPTTTITFKGVAVTPEDTPAEVTIGNVKYKVTVTNENLEGKYIYVNYFITNQRVDGSDGNKSIKILASEAYSRDGIKLSERVAATGTYINADVSSTTRQDVKYYKSVYQTGTNAQTAAGWTNKISSGVEAESVRYYEGVWSVFNGTEWVEVSGTTTIDPETYAGTTTSAPTGVAVITAYYLQKTTVTDEVTTYATDWGPIVNTATYNDKAYLDFAVKYLSGGNRTPNKFANTNTIIYNTAAYNDYKWSEGSTSGRYIMDIYAENSSNYEVYMITVTESTECTDKSKASTIPTITYTTADDSSESNNEQVAWVKSLTDDDYMNSVLYGENKRYSVFNVGGEPVLESIKAATGKGYLVTYYLREKEANLHVYYVDQSANFTFYSYGIKTSGEGFSAGIRLDTPWKGNLINGSVTNIYNKTQTVSADLSTMPAIPANYRYAANYTCEKIELENDNTDLYLYYTFDNAKYFVADFGLPLDIQLGKLSDAYETTGAIVTAIQVKNSKYGDITIDVSNKKFTYTLKDKTFLNTQDTLTVSVTGTLNYPDEDGEKQTTTGTVTYSVTIIPASTVYYEDSFATFTNANKSTGVNQGTEKGYWVTDGTTQTNVKQALEELGDTTTTKNVYGYDPAYADSTQFSMGSATKVTVDADTSQLGQSPTATFTFKGTGFDVISLTGNKSGTVMYTVTNTETKNSYSKLVNTYYGYTYSDGEWTTTDSANPSALYQIPVIKETGLDYSTYEVKISVLYGDYFNSTSDKFYSFWLDGIRVYDPMGKSYDYTKDNEGYPQYIKLRDELAEEDGIATSNAVFIDGADQADITTYANYGPNNEVYLANGQAISFKIPNDLTNLGTVQIGAKSPNGTAKMNVTVSDNTDPIMKDKEISTATEMYYKLDNVEAGDVITITNTNTDTNTDILSLTNLKLTFTAAPATSAESEIALAAMDTEEQEVAVLAVRALFAAPTPVVESFEPETFKVSLSKNSISAGQKATLTVKTSTDVEAITVNGETIDNYKTRYERSGWGWWAEKVEYRVFTYTVTATETTDYEVIAVNAEGAVSEAETVTLTVKAAQTNWWDNIWNNFFGKWF